MKMDGPEPSVPKILAKRFRLGPDPTAPDDGGNQFRSLDLVQGSSPLIHGGGYLGTNFIIGLNIVRQIWKESFDSLKEQSLMDLQLDATFMNDSNFNAIACVSPGIAHVSVTIATDALMHRLFYEAMLSDEVFPELPSSNVMPKSRLKKFDLTLPVEVSMEENLRSCYLPPAGMPPERARFANALANLSTLFVGFHEIAHIVRGHCDLARRRLRLSEILEHRNPESPKGISFGQRDQELLQLLEVDADVIATQLLLRALRLDQPNEGFVKMLGFSAEPEDLAITMGKILFCLRVTMVAWSLTEPPSTAFSVHPHPMVRAAFIRHFISIVAQTDSSVPVFSLKVANQFSNDNCKAAFDSLRFERQYRREEVTEFFTSQAEEYSRLSKAHISRRDDIVEFAWLKPSGGWSMDEPDEIVKYTKQLMLEEDDSIFQAIADGVHQFTSDEILLGRAPGDLGARFWRATKHELHKRICEEDDVKPWVNELVAGDLRGLILGIVSAITSQFDVGLAIAIPTAALLLKSGVKDFCKTDRPDEPEESVDEVLGRKSSGSSGAEPS